MILVYRVIETGQWCAPSMEDESIDIEEAEARAGAMAVTLGLMPGALEAIIAEADPRTGDLLAEIYVPPPPPEPVPPQPFVTYTAVEIAALPPSGFGAIAAVQEILAKSDALITNAELKTLTLAMARYLLRKWMGGWR